MRTREFCDAVARRLKGITREDVHLVIHALVEEVKEQLQEGEEVRLPGFGKLHVRKMRGVWKARFTPFVRYQEEFDRTFVENRDAADSPH